MRYLLYAEQNYAYAILRPLQSAIIKVGGEAAWFLAGSEINTQYLHTHEQRLTTIKDIIRWNPDVVLVPGNTVPSFIPGIKVAVFHGFNVAKATRSDDRGHFNIRGCFDLYCTQGPNTTQGFKLRSLKHGSFGVRETGWPALDPLFENKITQQQKRSNKPTILLCSTFTKELSCAPLLLKTVQQLRDTGKWHWLVQFHPKMPQDIVDAYKMLQNENLQFIETDNIIPYLQQADIMVCDTSSVMTMFILQRKPVVTFRNQSIGKVEHLINITETSELEKSITHALTYPDSYMYNVDKFITDTHPYQDGQSSERVLNAINNFIVEEYLSLQKKPMNIIRTFKERKKLKYWRFI